MLIDCDYSNSENDILLGTVVTVVCDAAVLQIFMHMYVVTMLLLIPCGDIEMKPGPYIGILTALTVTLKCTLERKYVNVVMFSSIKWYEKLQCISTLQPNI